MDFDKTFRCLTCGSQAKIEELTKGVWILHCVVCDNDELWNDEAPEPLDSFRQEEPAAKA